MDVLQRDDLPFPQSLPEFQQLFPNEAACAAYMEKARWGDEFVCPHCHAAGEPSLLDIAGDVSAPTFDELYSGEWEHPTCCG